MGHDHQASAWGRQAAARAGLALATGALALLMGAGAATAHEGATTTTVIAAQPTTGAAMPSAGPTVTAPGAPVEGSKGQASGVTRGLYVLLVVGGTAAAAVVLRTLLPVYRPDLTPRAANSVAAAALLFAGVGHCVAVPSHFAEAWMLGGFFVASGLLLFGQAFLIWLRPSAAAYVSVIASTTVFIALYFLVREVSLPLVDHIDPYVFEEYPVKIAEAVAATLAVAALVGGSHTVRRASAILVRTPIATRSRG